MSGLWGEFPVVTFFIPINWYFAGMFIPKESKMLTIANSGSLPLRELRIWIIAKSGL